MSVLTRLAITVPIAAASWMIGTNAMTAAASQEMAPTKAVELLAKSEAVDAKCTFLSGPEHEELAGYAAKAEIVAAGRYGAGKAQGAVKSGAAQGRTMTCNNDSEIVVRATMDAARRAMAQAEAASQKPRKVVKKQKNVRTDSRAAIARAPSSAQPGSLKRYSRLAAAYYVERRCRHLRHTDAMRFWRKIVASHNALLARHGPDAVRAAKNQAISRSRASGGCGSRTAKLVRAGYAQIARN